MDWLGVKGQAASEAAPSLGQQLTRGPLTGLQADQRVLQDLLSEKLPRLMAHVGQHRVDLSFITFNWFLVVFADSLISNILLQVWDAFLYEGTKVGAGGSWVSPIILWVSSLPLENGRTMSPVRLLRTYGSKAL